MYFIAKSGMHLFVILKNTTKMLGTTEMLGLSLSLTFDVILTTISIFPKIRV